MANVDVTVLVKAGGDFEICFRFSIYRFVVNV